MRNPPVLAAVKSERRCRRKSGRPKDEPRTLPRQAAEQNAGSLRAGLQKSAAFFERQLRRKCLILNLKPAPGFEPGTY